MSDIASIHDKFFRSIMADKGIAADYFRNCLPAFVSDQLDLTTLVQLTDTYVSGELGKSMSDVVYSCHLKDSKDEVKVSLLIEHKSYVDKYTPVQIGNYIFSGFLKQLQNEGRLSVIIPILLYHGPDKWEYQTLGGLFKDIEPEWRKFLPDFDYIYNNLGEVRDEQIASLNNSFLKASLFTLKYAFDEEWLEQHVVELLILSEGASQNLSKGFFVYLLQQGNLDGAKIIETMEALPPTTRRKVVTFADYFQRKGREEGREEGLNEKNRRATINMIRKGYSDADICDVLEVAAEYVSRMRAEISETE